MIRPKFSSILVFGDSTVDTGTNNYIKTLAKGNYFPYGKDFPGHVPIDRFSNGKLVPDFIASVLNLKDTVPPFLHPNLSDQDLLKGVSFAYGGSGFDDLTTALTGAIAVSQQIEYFKVYLEILLLLSVEEPMTFSSIFTTFPLENWSSTLMDTKFTCRIGFKYSSR